MSYDDVVNLALRRGIFFPASEIYQDAPAGFYDFGPVGASIRRKIVDVWRNSFVRAEGMLEMDGAVTMPADVFRASGHLEGFNDPMAQCTKCKTIHRADQLVEQKGVEVNEGTPVEELTRHVRDLDIKCPKCGSELMDVRQFNLLVKVLIGAAGATDCYLRGETCQSIFTAWHRIMNTYRFKLPQGVAQYGKAFRNEISPRQTLLRQVEFCQMESEIFFDPARIDEVGSWDDVKEYGVRVLKVGDSDATIISAEELLKHVSGRIIAYYMARTQQLFVRYGLPVEKLRFRQVGDDERAFYAKDGWDLEVETSLGWVELGPINYRTDYDIGGHMEQSGKDLRYTREDGSKFVPHVLEISLGTDRAVYAALELAFMKQDDRVWLSLPCSIVPLQAGVCPLLKNKPDLVKKAKSVSRDLCDCYELYYDESGSIGKRYARFDEIGVPYCVTVDFDSLENDDVTIRDRDSAEQKRVSVKDLRDVLFRLLTGTKFSEV